VWHKEIYYKTVWFNRLGQEHREDGPAVEYSDGSKAWLINGKLHRLDGPAIEYANGAVEYWFKGEQLTKEQLETKVF